ncbi:unnamed protein product [Brachionus calyciflorus]|uniref:Fanconi anemia group M protein n=1 Tax=Brachionus calyciflorus TaxID=104777 RepID=A0A813Q236_9BILA|nr:unnamed protein product [Brachionus calyciflorus]
MKRSLQNSKTAKQVSTSDNQQKTLFQCWKPSNKESNQPSTSSNSSLFTKPIEPPPPPPRPRPQTPEMIINDENDDQDDLELIQASDTFLNSYSINQSNNETINSKSNLTSLENDETNDDRVTLGIDENSIQNTQFTDTTGFDFNSGSVWIYPISENQPIRSYQYSIVEQCLYKNTMVVLPTGMGKTFIAAVVMYNFYRWYPLGKIIFMAPTKPLVNQQSDACYNIVGIPKSDMTSMTGQMAPDKRKQLWDTKRVFFLTPQVISNDILRGTVDVNLIKCIVLDEAHKALGEYAFCKVIESVNEVNKNFRIIALTATPGGDNKAVQNVITKLLISHIELRSDESIDIQQYSNNREVNKFVLPLTDEILKIRNSYYNVMRSPLKRLEINRILSIKDPGTLSKLAILTRREEFRKNIAPGMDSRRAGLIEGDLALLVTLVHALELLVQYGVKSFYMFLKSFVENTDGSKSAAQQNKLRTEIGNCQEMADYYEKFKEYFDTKSKPVPRNLRHPKLLKLEEVIIEHFKKFGKNETRVMIFSQYRESVYEITEMLSDHEDIKPMEFVGQSSAGGNRKTVTQKEQLEVVKKFREGGYNTLISTCVGEEGLDIGEVDLIINYDSQKSPIRLIQRMGRTGRKREGRIVVLLTEGKEEQSYKTSLSKKKNIYKVILNGQKHFQFYQNNPLMIPKGLRPKCHKMKIVIPQEDEVTETEKEAKKKVSKKKEKNIDDTEDSKKKSRNTKTSKKNSKNKNDEKDDSFCSQRLPDLDLDLDFNNKTINQSNVSVSFTKTPVAKTTQLKLFNDSNTLNIKSTKLDSDILSKQKLVPDPPNFKKIFKCLSKKGKENDELFSTSFDLSECIKLWQTDEDDFLTCRETSFNTSNILDEVNLVEKFENFYINLTNGISDDDDDEEKNDDEILPDITMGNTEIHDQQMIIDDTLSLSHKQVEIKEDLQFKPIVKETTLNDLFMDDDEDDDLKYLNQVNLDVKKDKFCIDETINEEPQIKPVNKILNNVKNEIPKDNSSPIVVVVQNQSTPRSILKKRNNISYSPLTYSPMVDDAKNVSTNKNLEMSTTYHDKSQSMIGITQALDILNSTNVNNKSLNKELFSDKENLFDMKSTLSFLFGNEMSPTGHNSIQVLDCSNLNSTGKRTRKLRFDEASIIETSGHKKSFRNDSSNDDESIIVRKRNNRVIKDLSSSFADESINNKNNKTNWSDDSEFDEVLGDNDKNMSHSDTQVLDDEDDDDDEFESEFLQINKKRNKKSNKNKFIMDEAEISGDDSEDDEDENDYDLRDSFVDTNEVSCDESMYLRYQKSVRDAENNRLPHFMTRKLRPITDDIFSQMPTQDTTYDYDSFCVPDDHVSIYEKKSKKKKKSKKSETAETKRQDDRFRRIKILNMTNDDMDTQDVQCSHYQEEKIQMTQLPKKKKIVNEEEEDDKDSDIEILTDEILMLESKAKQKSSNYNQSLVIIDEDDEEADFKPLLKKSKNKIESLNENIKLINSEVKIEPVKSVLSKTDLIIIDDENEFKSFRTKNSDVKKEPSISNINCTFKKPELIEKVQDKGDEDEDDEEFNNWINNTFTSNLEKPKSPEEKITQNRNQVLKEINNQQESSYFSKQSSETTINENKTFLSHFNQTKQEIPPPKAEIVKKAEKNKLNTTAQVNTTILDVPKNTNWIIVDGSLLTSAADILKYVRRIWQQDKVLIHQGLGCDFVISQRYAVLRFKWTEISAASMRDQIIDRYAKCKALYNNVAIIVVDDRENNKNRTKLFDSVIANLAKCSPILFAKAKTEDFSYILYYLSNNENQLGFSIDLECSRLLDKKKKDISFYLTLPNVSLINALYLSKNYENLSKFCNSSLEDLKSKGKMNDRKARKLLKFLIDT